MSDKLIGVLAAIRHHLVLASIARILERNEDFTLLAECSDGQAALRSAQALNPDVIILDANLQNPTGLAVLHQLRVMRTTASTVVVSDSADEGRRAMRLGAAAVLRRDSAADAFLAATRRAYATRVHTAALELVATGSSTRLSAGENIEDTNGRTRTDLTATEKHVVGMVMKGLKNRTLAEAMQVTEGTVKVHLHNIYQKLNLDGRLALMVWGREHGF
jgi:two-component system, NarL family, nitrate/nitrite response regulator NarL